MQIIIELTKVLHFIGLAFGGLAAFGIPLVAARAGAAPMESRPMFGSAIATMKNIGKTGVGLLIVTGAILATSSDFWSAAPASFWIKLLCVFALVVIIIAADKLGQKAMAGDASAADKVKVLSKVNQGLLVLIVFLAVHTFS